MSRPYELLVNSDMPERTLNRFFTMDTNLLFDIMEYLGFDEWFTIKDCAPLRSCRNRRAYFGISNFNRLIEQGCLTVNSNKEYQITVVGAERVNLIEIIRADRN